MLYKYLYNFLCFQGSNENDRIYRNIVFINFLIIDFDLVPAEFENNYVIFIKMVRQNEMITCQNCVNILKSVKVGHFV